MNLVGGLCLVGYAVVVVENMIHPGTFGTGDIGTQAVANHQAISGLGTRTIAGEVKNLAVGFLATGPQRGDDFTEISVNPRRAQLHRLHIIKSVGDDVERVIHFQIIQQFLGVRHQVRLAGSQMQVVFLQGGANCGITQAQRFEYQRKPRLPKFLLGYLTITVPVPKCVIDFMEIVHENLGFKAETRSKPVPVKNLPHGLA